MNLPGTKPTNPKKRVKERKYQNEISKDNQNIDYERANEREKD